MRNESMTGRERWQAVFQRKLPDRVPMDYWGTEETTAMLCTHFGCDFDGVCARLHIDLPYTVTGRYVGPPLPPGTNFLGVSTRAVDYGAGVYDEYAEGPLARFTSIEEIEANYTWPEPDWFDYSHLAGEIQGKEDRIIRGGGSEPMLWYKALRGEAQAFMDLVENPELVHYCLDKLFHLAFEDTKRIFEAIPGRVDFSYVAEDLGGQSGLLYSPEHIRQFLLPRMKWMMDLVRQNGSVVVTHSDGAIREIIPDLIEIGAQVLNPIQWRCTGMERDGIKRDFGDTLVLYGGVDNQQTLPFGTVADVEDEVRYNVQVMGEGGGFILAPCHNIQSITPVENVIALYETGYAEGWY